MPIITPVPSPNSSQPAPSQSDARARAIAALTSTPTPPVAAQAQETPVLNPNNVSPEEMTALKPTQTEEDPEKGQTNTTESTDEDKVETKSKEEPLSSQYAVLARKEKALRAKAQAQDSAFKAREDALAAREAALATKDAEYQSNYIPKNRLTEDTLGVLAEEGIDYEQLTQLALNPPPKQDPATKAYIAKLEARLSEIDGKLNKQVQSVQEAQTAQYKQAISQITRDAEKLVSTGDDYEAVRSTNSVQDVVDLIEKTFKEDGVLLTTEEACKLVEEELIEQTFKFSQMKKIQQRLAAAKAAPTAPAPKQSEQPSTQKPQMKTLTNAVGTQRQYTARERAIMAMKGELK